MPDTIAAAAERLRQHRTTSLTLTDASLDAIATHGPATNAFITVDIDGARARAREMDAERSRGIDRGPLHGIPISLKDLIDQAGVVTTAGSRVLHDRVAPSDALVTTRLRDAGAVILGRTNLHEFALGTTSEDSAFGPVRSPLDPRRSAGGSSGGSAVAVATGMGLASIGTDTGGSVRIPAAACGIVGLKGSFGEVPTDGVVPLSTTFDHVGPLARSVQDAAWLWQVLSGRAPEEVRPLALAGLRLNVLGGYFDRPLASDVRRAFHRAVDRLRSSGATLMVSELADTALIGPTYGNVVLPEGAHWHGPYLDARADLYLPNVHARLVHGRSISAVAYLDARDRCLAMRAIVDQALDDYDALILPTLPIVAPVLGDADVLIDPAEGSTMPTRMAMLKHTQLFNLTGHPAISLPLAAEGLPVGLQIVGRTRETAQLLRVAAACEWLGHET
jgi:aspartyl-tRNA(Asn)/glutamyl-tRNA(Gln) amidotransferase subunit A